MLSVASEIQIEKMRFGHHKSLGDLYDYLGLFRLWVCFQVQIKFKSKIID